MKVLIFSDWYYPGFKAGGPIQSCRNLVSILIGQVEFFVVTSDRDLGDRQPYTGITLNEWSTSLNGEKTFYLGLQENPISTTIRLIKKVNPDVVYFNSMFSFRFTIAPLIAIKMVGYAGRMILAPRGMLHEGALSLKSRKKKAFLSLFKAFGLHRKLAFHATDQQEYVDIKRIFPGNECCIVENIPGTNSHQQPVVNKGSGCLRMVFFSRIHEKKNLHYLLEVLTQVMLPGIILFDIYGYIDDGAYMEKCRQILQQLPENIEVNFKGPLPNAEVYQVLPNYHLFVLPTLGENFGHAIFEALSAGLPVMVSDKTPWRNLKAENAGWDLPLEDKLAYKKVIEEVYAMDHNTYMVLSEGARKKASDFLKGMDYQNRYLKLFRRR